MQGSTTTASTPPFAAVALFDFEPSNPDELALAKGTRVRVTAREGSDWLAGYAEDAPSATGIFPANYVRLRQSGGGEAPAPSPTPFAGGKRKPPPRRSRHQGDLSSGNLSRGVTPSHNASTSSREKDSVTAAVPRYARKQKMARQSIFEPQPGDKVQLPQPKSRSTSKAAVTSNLNPAYISGNHKKGGVSLDAAESANAAVDAAAAQTLSRRSAQSHTLRYAIFAHNIATASALFLLVMGPISIMWGNDCFASSLQPGTLGVLVVDGVARVRVNSEKSRVAAGVAGVNEEHFVMTASACQGQVDLIVGWIAVGVALVVIFVLEPLCGNRRNGKRCPRLCVRQGQPITVPWRALVYAILSAGTLGSAPTAIGGIGLLAAAVFHVVAALKGEHGDANARGRKRLQKGEKAPACNYDFPSLLRFNVGRGLWDSGHHDVEDPDSGFCDRLKAWWEKETNEQSNIGKIVIVVTYIAVNVYLFSTRFDVMVGSGALVDDDVLAQLAAKRITTLDACNSDISASMYSTDSADSASTDSSTAISTFACPASGVFPPPRATVRAFCENALNEEAGEKFEAISIGAFSGDNVMPPRASAALSLEPAQTGIVWIVMHSPESVSFRLELRALSGTPTAVHIHGPANPLGGNVGASVATAGVLYVVFDIDTRSLCPIIGDSGEEFVCEAKHLKIGSAVVNALRQGRAYINIHTAKHPDGEVRANLRETFVGMMEHTNVPKAAGGDANVPPSPENLPKEWAQGLSTVYLLDDGSSPPTPAAIDFVVTMGNLQSGNANIATGKVTDIDMIRKVTVDIMTAAGASLVSSSGTLVDSNDPIAVLAAEKLQSLCTDNVALVGRRTCTRAAGQLVPGCFGMDGFRGTDGTSASSVERGKCGPFVPTPVPGARTPSTRGLRSNSGNVRQFSSNINETVSALRTRRLSIRASNSVGRLLTVGDLVPAVAIAYALPPLASKQAQFAGTFVPTPFRVTSGGINAKSEDLGIASIRLLTPRSFAYVVEVHGLSGAPTQGIYIRGPGTRATQSSQLNVFTIAANLSSSNCDVTTASLTFCAGTAADVDEAVVFALIQGQLIIEVRTTSNPFGELRAEIQPVLSFGDLSSSSVSSSPLASLVSDSSRSTAEAREAEITRAAALLACNQPLARNLHLSYGGAWAKSFGQVLNFNCALVLYPILRKLLQLCNNYGSRTENTRSNGLLSYVPWHRNIDAHKLIAVVISVCTAGHVLAHFINYAKAPDATIARFHWSTWVTGAAITVCMLFIFSGGQQNVKRAHYELFINTHKYCAMLFTFLLFAHGPVFWQWGLLGFVLYATEVVLRQYRGSKHFFVRSVRYVPPVMELKFRPRHADEFRFLEGQYLYLNCPYVSSGEWHPFTISSAIGDLDRGGDEGWVSCHIRIIPGGWTEKLLRYFCAMEGRDLNIDDLEQELALNLYRRDAKGERQIGKDRGVDGKPLLLVDGPHAAPAQHYIMYDHVMMIGAGIGLTPSCSVLRSVLKYKWKKGWKPNVLRFYWVVRHSEISSFIWFLEQLVLLERELAADKATGNTKVYNIFEANIYITRAPKPGSRELTAEDDVTFLLNSSMFHSKRSNSVTRGLAPSPLARSTVKDHTILDADGSDSVGGGASKHAHRGMGSKKRSSVSVAGVASTTDIGYDIRDLYHALLNPSVLSRQQTRQQKRENSDMAENRLGSLWIWNGRPDWDQIFDQNAATKYEKVGVAFCGTPFIGKDLAKHCRLKSSKEKGLYFNLLKENF